MGEVMKPLGVYLNFFQPAIDARTRRVYRIMMVNDLYDARRGELRLTWEARDGREVAHAAVPFDVGALGASSYDVELAAPADAGEYVLAATALADTGGRTLSRRWVTVRIP